MTDKQREIALSIRKERGVPWHGPPHFKLGYDYYHLVGSCFEHSHFLGYSIERMSSFETTLLDLLFPLSEEILAWCVLSNHYHALVKTPDVTKILKEIGLMHGRLSYLWNGEENKRGRKCWHRCTDRAIRTVRHKWVTLNYINHNPVHHRYVKK